MANENLPGSKKHREIPKDGSSFFSHAELSEASKTEEYVAPESLKTSLMSMKVKLRKMDEIIEDIKIRLCQNNQEVDESLGI